jgi:hypothetical protein
MAEANNATAGKGCSFIYDKSPGRCIDGHSSLPILHVEARFKSRRLLSNGLLSSTSFLLT